MGVRPNSPPQDERVLEQAALLEILHERGAGLVHIERSLRHFLGDRAVVIPRAVVELDEAHATLGEAAREQAVRGEGAVAGSLHAIHFEHLFRLLREIGELGDGSLHLERHLVLRDARLDFRIDPLGGKDAVEPLHFLDDLPLGALADARGIADVVHGVAL